MHAERRHAMSRGALRPIPMRRYDDERKGTAPGQDDSPGHHTDEEWR